MHSPNSFRGMEILDKLYCPVTKIKHHIKIYHEREARIEKIVSRITDCHHEACQVMTNGDPEGLFFLS